MSKDINKQTIEAVRITKAIQDKYNISLEDYAALHNAFRKIHTEDILNETNNALAEYANAKQKEVVLIRFAEWLKNHLEIPFKPLVNLDKLKGKYEKFI